MATLRLTIKQLQWGNFDLMISLPGYENIKLSNFRFVGATEGYKYDSLTLYDKANFAGYEVKSFGNEFVLSPTYFGRYKLSFFSNKSTKYFRVGLNVFRSAAVTGCSPWTLYSNVNFSGSCVCLYPSDQTNCESGLFRDLPMGIGGNVASVRRGCYCTYHKYPNSV